MEWIKGLDEWRSDRNITKPSGKIVDMLVEEIEELYEGIVDKDEHEIVDALADCMVLCVNELSLMGYDVDKVMSETVKEISSRRQCPSQKEAWDLGLCVNDKWLKDISQIDIYKAVYEDCML